MADVTVKIAGNVTEFKSAIDEAMGKLGELGSVGTKIAEGLTFAGATAAIYKTIEAYGEQEQALNQLNQALQNQGIYSASLVHSYEEQAESISHLTGIDKSSIEVGQARLQSMIGMRQVTEEMTHAAIELGSRNGDVTSGFQLLGQAANGNARILKQLNITINEHASFSERLAEVTKKVNQQLDGTAESQAKGVGSTKLLALAMHDLAEDIGAKFAPAFESVVHWLTEAVEWFRKHDEVIRFAADMLAVVASVAAFNLVAPVMLSALSMIVLALNGAQVATKGLVASTGLGLLVLAVVEIYQHWGDLWPKISAFFSGFVTFIMEKAGGVAKVIAGLFKMDSGMIESGIDQATNAYKTATDKFNKVVFDQEAAKMQIIDESDKKQDANKKHDAEAAAAEKARIEKIDEQIRDEQNKLILLEIHAQGTREEELLKKHIANLQKIKSDEYKGAREELLKNDAEIKKEQTGMQEFEKAIDSVMHSEKLAASKEAFDQLTAMQSSKNSTLKSIGKASAIASVTISIAESVAILIKDIQKIIPFPFSIPVQAAAVAARLAFGAEQIGSINAAADGGVMTGGVPGRDSIAAMLMPGELVVPTKNFDEVINAMVTARGGDSTTGQPGGSQGNGKILVGFDGREASQVLTLKINENRALGITRETATVR